MVQETNDNGFIIIHPAKEVGEAGTERPAYDVDHLIEGK